MTAGMEEPPLHRTACGPPPHPVAREQVWGEMLRVAARLGVGPEAFWRLSLREWRMLTERPRGDALMGRRDFERMAEAWPD
jgi:hypothetical protein